MTGEITLAWDQVTEFPCPGLKQMKKKSIPDRRECHLTLQVLLLSQHDDEQH